MKIAKILCFFALLLLVGCHPQDSHVVSPLIKVEVTEVEEREVQNYIEAIGNVYESSIVEIRPQVQGILLKAYVAQGALVEKGDLLYEIDPRPYQATLEEAKATLLKDQASLELAQNTVNRYTEVAKKDFISPLTFEQYQSNVKTGEAQVAVDQASIRLARINLGYCKVFAPISGKIGVYNIYPGNLVVVNDSQAIVEIRKISPVDIRFTIPQKDFQEIQQISSKENLKLKVLLPYQEDRAFDGTLYFIDNHIDLQSGTILLKGSVPNETHDLWPGEFVRVRVYTKLDPHALVIPLSALQTGQDGYFVYRINEDQAERVSVKIGQKAHEQVVVTEGLNRGDKVVTKGQLNIHSGSKVTWEGKS